MNGIVVYQWAKRLRDHGSTRLVAGSFASFGARSVVSWPVRLDGVAHIQVGSADFVGPGCWLHAEPWERSGVVMQLGDRVSIAGSTTISAVSSVVIEDSVLIAGGVYIADHSHAFGGAAPVRDQGITRIAPVTVERGAWLGQNVVVLPGVTIGAGAVVGANSVVAHDIPPGAVAVGSPARVRRPSS